MVLFAFWVVWPRKSASDYFYVFASCVRACVCVRGRVVCQIPLRLFCLRSLSSLAWCGVACAAARGMVAPVALPAVVWCVE